MIFRLVQCRSLQKLWHYHLPLWPTLPPPLKMEAPFHSAALLPRCKGLCDLRESFEGQAKLVLVVETARSEKTVVDVGLLVRRVNTITFLC